MIKALDYEAIERSIRKDDRLFRKFIQLHSPYSYYITFFYYYNKTAPLERAKKGIWKKFIYYLTYYSLIILNYFSKRNRLLLLVSTLILLAVLSLAYSFLFFLMLFGFIALMTLIIYIPMVSVQNKMNNHEIYTFGFEANEISETSKRCIKYLEPIENRRKIKLMQLFLDSNTPTYETNKDAYSHLVNDINKQQIKEHQLYSLLAAYAVEDDAFFEILDWQMKKDKWNDRLWAIASKETM